MEEDEENEEPEEPLLNPDDVLLTLPELGEKKNALRRGIRKRKYPLHSIEHRLVEAAAPKKWILTSNGKRQRGEYLLELRFTRVLYTRTLTW